MSVLLFTLFVCQLTTNTWFTLQHSRVRLPRLQYFEQSTHPTSTLFPSIRTRSMPLLHLQTLTPLSLVLLQAKFPNCISTHLFLSPYTASLANRSSCSRSRRSARASLPPFLSTALASLCASGAARCGLSEVSLEANGSFRRG